jgi:hypothetical protein
MSTKQDLRDAQLDLWVETSQMLRSAEEVKQKRERLLILLNEKTSETEESK